jgi:hypothetical protein
MEEPVTVGPNPLCRGETEAQEDNLLANDTSSIKEALRSPGLHARKTEADSTVRSQFPSSTPAPSHRPKASEPVFKRTPRSSLPRPPQATTPAPEYSMSLTFQGKSRNGITVRCSPGLPTTHRQHL